MVEVKPSIIEVLVACLDDCSKIHVHHGILILGKSPIKWRQNHDMTTAVDWDVKRQFRQTNKTVLVWEH